MTYDGSNRKHIRQAEKASAIAQNERRLYISSIMSTLSGRAWMHDLLARCHIGHTAFVAGHPDVTDFQLGEQNVGLQLWADAINVAPHEYALMMAEANQKEVTNDRRYSDDRVPAAGQPAGGASAGRDVEGSEPTSEYDPYAFGEDSIH